MSAVKIHEKHTHMSNQPSFDYHFKLLENAEQISNEFGTKTANINVKKIIVYPCC